MENHKNFVEILLFIFLVAIGYYYERLSGALVGGLSAILLIIRGKMMEKIKW